MSLIRACRGISIPSADVKGISGTGATVGSEDKEHPLTSSQPQMLISEADTQKCRLLPCGEQFPLGARGNMGQGTGPLGAGAKPLPCGAHPVDCVNLPRCYGFTISFRGVLNAPLEKGAGGRLPLTNITAVRQGNRCKHLPLWGSVGRSIPSRSFSLLPLPLVVPYAP